MTGRPDIDVLRYALVQPETRVVVALVGFVLGVLVAAALARVVQR